MTKAKQIGKTSKALIDENLDEEERAVRNAKAERRLHMLQSDPPKISITLV